MERILIDCAVAGSAARTPVGRSLCAQVAAEARRQSARPVSPLADAASPDPMSDLTVNVAAVVSHAKGGDYRLALSVGATRRGFPASSAVRRTRGDVPGDGDPSARVRELIAASLRPIFSGAPAHGRVPPPTPRS